MKKILLVLLFATIANAQQFSTNKVLKSEAVSRYETPSTFKITDVKVLNIVRGQALISLKVNGVEKTVKASTGVNEFDYHFEILSFSAVFKDDLLADGSQCDEYENFSYSIVGEIDNDFVTNSKDAKVEGINVVREYSYDVCHSSVETEVAYYTKK